MVLNFLLGSLKPVAVAHPRSVDSDDEMDTTPDGPSTSTRKLLNLNAITDPVVLKQLLQQFLASVPALPSIPTHIAHHTAPSLTALAPPALVALCQLIDTLTSGKVDSYAQSGSQTIAHMRVAVLHVLTSMPNLVKTLWAILSRSRYA